MAPPPVRSDDRKDDYRKLTGSQRAAILLMSIEEETATKILNMMEEEEIKEISSTMASLGTVSADTVERLYIDFVESMSNAGRHPWSCRSHYLG
jgi:flagellar motor switch protein FliG